MNKMPKHVRMEPQARRQSLLQIAVEIAKTKGFDKVTKYDIANKGKISHGLITHYFPTMKILRYEIIQFAIQHEVLPVLAQGISRNEEQSLHIKPELKTKVLEYLTN